MKQGQGLLIVQKGVKYGLQAAAANRAQPAKAPARPAAGAANVFGMDSDDEDDVATQVAKQAEKKRAAAKVCAQAEGFWTCWQGCGGGGRAVGSTCLHAVVVSRASCWAAVRVHVCTCVVATERWRCMCVLRTALNARAGTHDQQAAGWHHASATCHHGLHDGGGPGPGSSTTALRRSAARAMCMQLARLTPLCHLYGLHCTAGAADVRAGADRGPHHL